MKKTIFFIFTLMFIAIGFIFAKECGPCIKAQNRGCHRGVAIGSGMCTYHPETMSCQNENCIGGTASIMKNGSCKNLIGNCKTTSYTYMGDACVKTCFLNGASCYCAYSGTTIKGAGGHYIDCD